MKRGDRLKPTPMPPRQSPMARSQSLTRQAAKAKRPKVTPEEKHARDTVRARSGGVCEICDAARATNFQHRLAKAHGGPWEVANGLAVCGMGNVSGCHGRIHQNPIEAEANGWTVLSGHDFRSIPVLHAVHGRVLLGDDGSITPVEREGA